VRIPLRAAVEGSPIKLHDATLGLSNITTPQTLSWAPVAQGAAPVKKTIRVLNNGPLPATLAWEVLQAPDPEKPLAAKLRLAKDGSGPMLELDRRPLPPFASRAFRITPATDVLPAGGERRFEVVFDASAEMGSGEAAFEAMLNAALTHPMPVTLADGTATDKHPELRLRLSGHSLIPRLAMSERSKLKFKVSPTMAPDDPAYTRTLTLTNDSKTTLEFTLAIPPPFVLVEARCSIAQFKIMGNKQVDNTSPFCLPPQSSLLRPPFPPLPPTPYTPVLRPQRYSSRDYTPKATPHLPSLPHHNNYYCETRATNLNYYSTSCSVDTPQPHAQHKSSPHHKR
jgi:hypothetical protein